MTSKPLPKDLTSYDILKCLAVVLMIVDHFGHYFYLDELWFRAFGRLCVPMWMFLVGYAASRKVPAHWWIFASVLTLSGVAFGIPILPLNILFTIIFIRLTIDPVMRFLLKSQSHLWAGSVMLFVLSIPSSILTEYGTQAFIMAVFGYLVRHKDNLPYDNRDTLSYYLVFSVFSYIVGAQLGFMFGQTQLIFLVIGLIAVHFYLLGFENRTYPQISQKIGMPLRRIIQFGGRRTLEIYFAHVILFRIIAHFINPHMYSYTGINLIDLAPGEDFPDILEAGKGPIDK